MNHESLAGFHPEIDPHLVVAINQAGQTVLGSWPTPEDESAERAGWMDGELERLLAAPDITTATPEMQDCSLSATPERESGQILATIAELSPDVWRKSREIVTAIAAGRLVARELVDTSSLGMVYESTYDMLMAPEDDPIAEAGGVADVVTMLAESLEPHTNVVEVEAPVDEYGTVWQYGRNAYSVVQNSLAFDPSPTTVAESINMIAIGQMVCTGDLKPGEAVWELSIVRDGDRHKLRDMGYFIHSMTFIARRVSLNPDGRTLTIRSHFIAGADVAGIAERLGPVRSEADADAREAVAYRERFDKLVMSRFFREVLEQPGHVDATSDELLSLAGKIDESRFDGGEAGIIASLDSIIADTIGADTTFYGIRGATGNHAEFIKGCRESRSALTERARHIWRQARKAVRQTGMTPSDVPTLLRGLTKQYLAEEVSQGRADVMILGAESAHYMIGEWEARARGDFVRASAMRKRAVETARPGGCAVVSGKGSGKSGGDDGGSNDADPSVEDYSSSTDTVSDEKDEYGSLTFLCPKGHSNTRPPHMLIPRCKHCGISVSCGDGQKESGLGSSGWFVELKKRLLANGARKDVARAAQAKQAAEQQAANKQNQLGASATASVLVGAGRPTRNEVDLAA